MLYIERQNEVLDKYAKYNSVSPNTRANTSRKQSESVARIPLNKDKRLKEKLEVYTGMPACITRVASTSRMPDVGKKGPPKALMNDFE